nr:hypothetical protein GCM10025699_17650 [Microbacterium flavescens]
MIERTPKEEGVAGRVGRGKQEEQPTVFGKPVSPVPVFLLHATGDIRKFGLREPTRESGLRVVEGKLQQGERVAVRFGDDPFAHIIVDGR